MRVQLGEWIFNIENIENHKISYSRLSAENLHFFDANLVVNNEKVSEFENRFNEYKDGEILISDSKLDLENSKFDALIRSTSTSNMLDYKTYTINFSECSSKKLVGVKFENIEIQPYEISQEISKGAVIINIKTFVTEDQFKKINELSIQESNYFPVKRIGIDDTLIQMRFGRNLWSKTNNAIKMALILVEDKYDQEDKEKFHGMAEPELSIAIKQIKQLRTDNTRLLDLLLKKEVITIEEKTTIEKELTIDELQKQHYLYNQVKDIDEWR